MDFTKIIKELENAGIRQVELARAAGVNASTIAALKSGQNSQPKYTVGKIIVDLHTLHCSTQKAG